MEENIYCGIEIKDGKSVVLCELHNWQRELLFDIKRQQDERMEHAENLGRIEMMLRIRKEELEIVRGMLNKYAKETE